MCHRGRRQQLDNLPHRQTRLAGGSVAKIIPILPGKCDKYFSLTPLIALSKNKYSADLSKQLAGA
jgi:hypothetical protein